MNSIDHNFVLKFNLEEFEILKLDKWLISLRPQQPTIGSMVLTLNRKCETFGDIDFNEGCDLSKAFQIIQKGLANSFKPEKINYLALMMVDNQVHFHVIPRYSKSIYLNKKEFKDNYWPGPPILEPLEVEKDDLMRILALLRESFRK